MTRERRLAISQWAHVLNEIVRYPGCFDIESAKRDFCTRHHLNWLHDCWFCQYVRKDYRAGLPSRASTSNWGNMCEKCPIYKYEEQHGNITHDGQCGCAVAGGLYSRVKDKDKKAAVTIMELLGDI